MDEEELEDARELLRGEDAAEDDRTEDCTEELQELEELSVEGLDFLASELDETCCLDLLEAPSLDASPVEEALRCDEWMSVRLCQQASNNSSSSAGESSSPRRISLRRLIKSD